MIGGFVFYGSFYDALSDLPDDLRLEAYDAICKYALLGEIPDCSGTVSAVFKLVRPQIDANRKRREAGRKGGEANAKQTVSKPQANGSKGEANASTIEAKEKVKVKEKVKEKEKEIKEKERLTPEVRKELDEFIEHRKKIKKPMTDHAVELLINKLNTLADSDDERIQMLREAIEKGWQTVYKHDRGKPPNKFNRFEQRAYGDDLENELLFGG